jgi:hypothetical protein
MSVHQDTDIELMVYVRLLDEGTDVWQPVRATALPGETFRLLEPDGYDPNAETWGFPPLTEVRRVTKKFTDGREWLRFTHRCAPSGHPTREPADPRAYCTAAAVLVAWEGGGSPPLRSGRGLRAERRAAYRAPSYR